MPEKEEKYKRAEPAAVCKASKLYAVFYELKNRRTVSEKTVRRKKRGRVKRKTSYLFSVLGKMILLTKKNTTIETPPLRTVVPIL